MKILFDEYSFLTSKQAIKLYSTSFYLGTKLLNKEIRKDIYALYGLVRLADEIVDSFHNYNKANLLHQLKSDTLQAIQQQISINPVINAFQITVNKHQIEWQLIELFFKSMEMDLEPSQLYTPIKYQQYILGSAEVIGLMCLKIFLYRTPEQYQALKPFAMQLGSAFQKINFLRDLQCDYNMLGRCYFPDIDLRNFSSIQKQKIENEIKQEFCDALKGIKKLPNEAKLGVYLTYSYYSTLLKRIEKVSVNTLMQQRIRLNKTTKTWLLIVAYCKVFLKLV